MKKSKFVKNIDCGFEKSLLIIEYVLYFIATAVIVAGSQSAFMTLLQNDNMAYIPSSYIHEKKYFFDIKKARIFIGEALNMSLTFILAADIVRTIRSPNYWQLGKLIILVVLREFIVYSLNLEIQDLRKHIRDNPLSKLKPSYSD